MENSNQEKNGLGLEFKKGSEGGKHVELWARKERRMGVPALGGGRTLNLD